MDIRQTKVSGRRELTWDQRCADEDVHLFALLSEQSHLGIDELLGHLLGVATHAVPRLLDVDFQRLRPKRLELLQSCWSAKVNEQRSSLGGSRSWMTWTVDLHELPSSVQAHG